MKTKNPNAWKRMSLRLPPEVHRALKVHVAEEGGSMTETIERLVREYLVKGTRA